MCNRIQTEDYKRLKPSGKGYKLVEKSERFYFPLVVGGTKYELGTIYKWSPKKAGGADKDYGFCFFLSLKEARLARTSWGRGKFPGAKTAVLLKIRYTEGMASFTSKKFDGKPRRFAITKEFVALEEIN